MHRTLFFLLAFALAGSPVAAKERAPDSVKKAKAEALVAQTKSDGVWRTDGTGEITHLASGLKCAVSGDGDPIQLKELIVYPKAALGVSCAFTHTTEAGLTDTTLYVYSALGLTNEQLLAQSVGAIEMAHPDWKRTDGPSLSIEIKGKAGNAVAPAAARFATAGSPEKFSSIWVGAARSWAIKVRTTYPRADATPMELMSLVYWAHARLHIARDDAAK
ncbi:MAG: hypothetical protein ACKVRO_06110 [Micropepsaceae bacterium]